MCCVYILLSSNELYFSLCAFSNAVSFKSINADDIDYVEKFIKFELSLCHNFTSHVHINDGNPIIKLSETNKVHFYGEYTSNPGNFQFSLVERKLIEFLAAHVKDVVDRGKVNNYLCHFNQTDSSNEMAFGKYFGDIQNKPTTNSESPECLNKTLYLLNKLIATAKQNALRDKCSFRYDVELKEFFTYIRMLAGPFAYETLQKNLPLCVPALSSTNRYIRRTNCKMVEGILRCEELRIYLEERKLPFEVALSEDATRIDGNVQYDARTDQMIGFVLPIDPLTGMPIAYSYRARNEQEILQHFACGQVSHFVNVIMAQPLGKVAPFCLLVFGTNSKYTAEDVSKRWIHIVDQLRNLNINVISISSDSDPKYNSAMRKNSCLGFPLSISMSDFGPINWFSCANLMPPFYVQDTTHIGTKMRNFMLKTKQNCKKLPFGTKYFINIGHLKNLKDNFSKSEHMLCDSTLNPNDRQNFSSVLRM